MQKISILILLSLVVIGQSFSANQFSNYGRRYLESKKESLCTDVFKKETLKDPNGLDFKSDQVVTNDERKQAKNIRSKLEVVRSKKEAKKDIVKLLNDADYQGYFSSIIVVAVPFLVLCVISIFGCITYYFGFLLENRCCDKKDKKYTEAQLGNPATCIIFFGILAMASIVYGFYVARNFGDMNKVLKCSLVSVLDEIVYGADIGSYQWVGIGSGGQTHLDDIIKELDTIGEKQEEHFADTDYIKTDLDALFSTNMAIYEYYHDLSVPGSNPNPSPISDGTNPAKDSFTSYYLQYQFGDNTVENTTTYLIEAQLNATTKVFAESALKTKDSSSFIKLNVQQMKQQLVQGKSSMASSAKQFQDYRDEVEKQIGKIDSRNDMISIGIMVFFATQLAGTIFAFFGVMLTHCIGKPKPKFRFLLHIGWMLMSVMMLIGFIISVFLMPMGVMLSETCTWMDGFINNAEEFNDPTYTFIPKDVRAKLNVCLFGDGNLSNEFNFQQELDKITEMIDNVGATINISDKDDPNYVDLNQATVIMSSQIELIQAIKEGRKVDSNSTTEDNPEVSRATLRSWADHSVQNSNQQNDKLGDCQKSRDEYVFDSSLCNYGTEYDGSGAAAQNIPNEVCIQISNMNLIDSATRYATISSGTGGCDAQVESKISSYFNSLLRYDIARRSFFSSIEQDEEQLKTDTDAYHNRLNNFVLKTKAFQLDIQSLIDKTSDPKTGLISKFNCQFLTNSIDRVFDATCVNYVNPIFKVIVTVAFISLFMLVGSFFSYTLAIRYARKARYDQKIKPEKSKKDRAITKIK